MSIVTAEEGHCVMYDVCGKNNVGLDLNCAVNHTSVELNDSKSLEMLNKYCWFMMDELKDPKTGKVKTCCSPNQIVNLAGNFTLPSELLSRCPSCLRNFYSLYCHFTCSQDQSTFANVTLTLPGPDNSSLVEQISYSLSSDYAYGLFNSCRDVQMPSNNQKALDVMCGGQKPCRVTDWLKYMGNPSLNPATPFEIDFKIGQNEDGKSLNKTIKSCAESSTAGKKACSCQDCRETCPPFKEFSSCTTPTWKFWDINGSFIIAGIVFIVLCGVIGVVTIFYLIVKENIFEIDYDGNAINRIDTTPSHSQASQSLEITQVGCLETAGLNFDNFLTTCFYRWGCFCARHCIFVIVLSLLSCAILISGVYFYKQTTNPVELWSSPQSLARREKNNFDNSFGPFYRTEQLILIPKNSTPYLHHNPFGQFLLATTLYGPVFFKDFLHAALDLQLAVMNLSATDSATGDKIKLNDICFKPLAPDNKECTIQSVLQYFQNKHEVIDKIVKDPNWPPFSL